MENINIAEIVSDLEVGLEALNEIIAEQSADLEEANYVIDRLVEENAALIDKLNATEELACTCYKRLSLIEKALKDAKLI